MLEFWRNPFGKESRGKRTAEEPIEGVNTVNTADVEPPAENPMVTSALPKEQLADGQLEECKAALAGEQDQGAATTGGSVVEAENAADELPAPAAPAPADDDIQAPDDEAPGAAKPWRSNLRARPRGRQLVKPESKHPPLTAQQRLLLLDTWQRSGLPARDFAA